MITILGITLTYEALGWFVLFLASELIGMNPKLKENSVLQLVLQIATMGKFVRKEDDQIDQIKNVLRGGRR
jgi:hypothetical protein